MPPKGNPKSKGTQGGAGSDKRKGMRTIRDDDNFTETDDAHDNDWTQQRTLVKPDDQLQLSDAELKEEFTRILTANNPHAPQNIVRYSFKEKQYKQTSSVDQLAIHFALDGNMIHKESDEARRQQMRTGQADEYQMRTVQAPEQAASEAEPQQEEEGEKPEGEEVEAGGDDEGKEEGQQEESATPAPSSGDKKLTNQFNYSERASQTYNNPLRERGTVTEPPPRATYASNVTQWEIFDAYQEDFEKQNTDQEKNKEKKVIPGRKEEESKKKKLTVIDSQMTGGYLSDDISRIANAAKIVERMVNQNTFDDIAQDFKYYEDPSDEFRDQEGTLLPLWKFSYEKSKKLAVTSLCWSPKYSDLFAVGHGSYDFLKQNQGLILFYTMKSPTHPEYIYHTPSGVMCLDIHPDQPYLLAVGFYDGSVAVYNVTDSGKEPAFKSTAKTGKHTDPVWQVKWQKDDLDNNLNFFSLSSDGRVVNWTLVKNELNYHDIITLTLDDIDNEGPDGTKVQTLGAGLTFSFHSKRDHQFLVGTEEGRVYLCSKAYASTFIDSSDAHHMAVYRVEWNPYHQDVFITCSADWSVKIWDRSYSFKEPVFTFDLNSAVGAVTWAPYSSTIFAAATADGKVHVYDLNINKYTAVCEQLVTAKKKTKLTHISFNPDHPILIVGDDRGYVTSLKLSPNLRKQPKEKKGQEQQKSDDKAAQKMEQEVAKLEKLLSMVRQPDKN